MYVGFYCLTAVRVRDRLYSLALAPDTDGRTLVSGYISVNI